MRCLRGRLESFSHAHHDYVFRIPLSIVTFLHYQERGTSIIVECRYKEATPIRYGPRKAKLGKKSLRNPPGDSLLYSTSVRWKQATSGRPSISKWTSSTRTRSHQSQAIWYFIIKYWLVVSLPLSDVQSSPPTLRHPVSQFTR